MLGSVALAACSSSGEAAGGVKNAAFAAKAAYVVAAMGDSFGSGEGNPLYGNGDWEDTQWYSSAKPKMSEMCHRAKESGFYKAVRRLEARYPNVEFIRKNFACSGAVVQHLAWNEQVPEHKTFAAYGEATVGSTQLEELKAWLAAEAGGRSVDALYLSIGGNNANFGGAVRSCILTNDDADVPCHEREAVREGSRVASERASGDDESPTLWELYEALKSKVNNELTPRQVVISTYPNFAQRADGRWCQSDDYPLELIGPTEWEGAWEAIGAAMNATIRERAAEFSWDVAEMENRFSGHSICEADRWVNNDEDASWNQGNDLAGGWLSTGIVHPNDDGYEAYADAIEAAIEAQLRERMTPGAVRLTVNPTSSPGSNRLAGTGVSGTDPWHAVQFRAPAGGTGIDTVSSLRVRVVLGNGRVSVDEYVPATRSLVYVQAPAGARVSVAACGFRYGARTSDVLCGERSAWTSPVTEVRRGSVTTTTGAPRMTIVPSVTTTPRPGARPTTVPTTSPRRP